MMFKRIAIVGCRPSKEIGELYLAICQDVYDFVATLPPGTIIVSGGAEGVDTVAVNAARQRGFIYAEHFPDYVKYGPQRAPLERNTLIVRDCDELHAWPAPWSRGTWDTIRKAHKIGVPTTIHEVKL